MAPSAPPPPASPADHIATTWSDGVAVLTIHRQGRRNALHWPLWLELGQRLDEVAASPARALVITGAGPHFCAGMDLKPDNPLVERILPAVMHGEAAAARGVIQELKAITGKLLSLPIPSIAAVEGACAGGGYELALHCDCIVAARGSRFGLPEVRVGMAPDVGGTTLLARRIGRARATMVISSGRVYEADAAFALGMVDQLCDTGTALSEAMALGLDIARGGPRAVAAALSCLRESEGLPLSAAFARETEAGVAALTSGEPLEGILAFGQRRDPDWGAPR